MAIAQQLTSKQIQRKIPTTMTAAVYRGKEDVRLETVPVPEIRRGEILVKVHTCGICGTDLKKIATGSHSAPRIFGHETAVVIGQGPIGIILSVLAKRARARVITSDLYEQRLTISKGFGLENAINNSSADVVAEARRRSEGRGVDAAILAVGSNSLIRTAMDAVRPGGRVLLFAQTQHGEAVFDPAAVCVDEKTLIGSYSASVDLQDESVRFVMGGEMNLERLVSHRFPLAHVAAALELATHPQPGSMKIVIQSE